MQSFLTTTVFKTVLLTALLGGFLIPLLAIGVSATQGDVLINEFSSNGSSDWVELLNTTDFDISLSGWKIQDITFGDIPGTATTTIGAVTIPANGIVVIDIGNKLNQDGDVITLFDDSINQIHAVSFGDQNPEGVPHADAPGSEQSAAFVLPSAWTVGTPTKGWFNDAGEPEKAPLLSAIADALSAPDVGITTNIGTIPNPSATPNTEVDGALYFEKTGEGKIVFEAELNLTDENTVAVLQTLGEKMELSDGHVAFDSETAEAMATVGAKIYMYGLDFDSTPNIVVKDDENNVIDGTNIIEEVSYDPETGELSFTAAHFTQFDAEDSAVIESADPTDVDEEFTPELGSHISIGDTAYLGRETTYTGPAIGTGDPDSIKWRVTVDGPSALTADMVDLDEVGFDDPDGDGNSIGTYHYPFAVVDENLVATGSCDDVDTHDNACTHDIGFSLDEDDIFTNADKIVFAPGAPTGSYTITYELVNTADDSVVGTYEVMTELTPEDQFNVCGNCTYQDIQSAVDAASPGDTVTVAAGDYEENLTVDKNLTLVGNDGAEETTVSGDGDNVLAIMSDVTDLKISGFTFTDGATGIYASDSFTEATINIHDVVVTDNEEGGIYFSGASESTLTFTNVTVTDNSDDGIYLSGNEGGIVNSTVLLQDNTISDNAHAGIYIERVDEESTLDVIDNTITGNNNEDEENNFPGVYINDVLGDSAVTLRGNTVSDNNFGRGVWVCNGECSSSALTFQGNTIKNNNSDGLFVSNLRSGTLDVLGNTVTGSDGPGFELIYGSDDDTPPTATVSENTFDGNFYGIYISIGDEEDGVEITMTIGENNVIKNNSTDGIFLNDFVSGVTITGNTIQNNGVETTGIEVWSASGNSAHNNTIVGNGEVGVSNEDAENVFDATNNWWGSADGPEGEGNNGVSGDVNFDPWYTNAARTTLSNGVVTNASYGSPVDGQADVPPGATEIVLNNETELNLSAELADDMVTLQSGVDGEPIVLTNVDLDDVTVSIPDETLITGPDGWDGIIQPPAAGTPSGTPPAGFSVGDTVISVGSPDGTLLFDKAVTIVLAGVTGTVGYRPSGSDVWQTITSTCGGTYAAPEAPVAPGECSINNGTDTKIVTFHFTSFGGLNPTPPTPAPSSGGGGGGGGGVPSLFGVTNSGGNTGGQVLGAATSVSSPVPTTASTPTGTQCVTSFLGADRSNDSAQVKVLQTVLLSEGFAVEVNGTFDSRTVEAVKGFQLKYAADVLAPWGITEPTGFVYLTTRNKLNALYCGGASGLSAEEQAIIDDYKKGDTESMGGSTGTITAPTDTQETDEPDEPANDTDEVNTSSQVGAVQAATEAGGFWERVRNFFGF